jgi:hypothetical protein
VRGKLEGAARFTRVGRGWLLLRSHGARVQSDASRRHGREQVAEAPQGRARVAPRQARGSAPGLAFALPQAPQGLSAAAGGQDQVGSALPGPPAAGPPGGLPPLLPGQQLQPESPLRESECAILCEAVRALLNFSTGTINYTTARSPPPSPRPRLLSLSRTHHPRPRIPLRPLDRS